MPGTTRRFLTNVGLQWGVTAVAAAVVLEALKLYPHSKLVVLFGLVMGWGALPLAAYLYSRWERNSEDAEASTAGPSQTRASAHTPQPSPTATPKLAKPPSSWSEADQRARDLWRQDRRLPKHRRR